MLTSRIGILGSGMVAQALGSGFVKHGCKVTMGTRDSGKLSDWKAKAGGSASVGTFSDAAKTGEILVLAVKATIASEVLELAGPKNLHGKTVIDTTNPIADLAPMNGVLQYFTSYNESLMEKLQKQVPGANFVKAFSCAGNAFMVNPDFGGIKPTMFICGNNDIAKNQVRDILTTFGWEIEDMGMVEAARAIEPLAMLWCIPGLRENRWTHAFKLLMR